jgi:hypothetical protein
LFSATAQQSEKYPKPDYADIEKLTSDKSSAFYYSNLFEKYSANDTTLSPRDYWMLYYGYYFNKAYVPLQTTEYAGRIMQVLNKPSLSASDWKEVDRYSKMNLEANPFDLKGLNIAWIAQRQLGDSAAARVYFVKLKNIVEVILSTGDGLTESTALHVLDIAHEYDILNILGYEFDGDHNQTAQRSDYLTVKANAQNLSGLFFSSGQQADEHLRVAQATVSQ